MSKTYRVGLVGSGFGVHAHLPALLAHPRFEVVALASPHRAAVIAKERSIRHAFPSCAEMVKELGDGLDAVVVASPPFAHLADVQASLDAGKHVLCEKPFALNVPDAQAMVAAARKAGTACALSHEFRWVPQRIAIKEMIDNGHLAAMREIEFTQLLSFLRVENEKRERGWWFEQSKGGGVAGALMSHIIDTANWLAGRPPKHVTGFIRTANAHRRDAEGTFDSNVDDGVFALLDYGEGLIARLTADATVSVESLTLAVHGAQRTVVASGTSLVDMRLFSVEPDETDELAVKPSPYAKFESINGSVPLLMELYDAWIAQIETGKSNVPTFEEALETQRVLAALGYSI